jgi:hypothetical protein
MSFYRLGRLLGRLHTISVPEDVQEGGAWHHLSTGGIFKDECNAAIQLLKVMEGKHAEIKDEKKSF